MKKLKNILYNKIILLFIPLILTTVGVAAPTSSSGIDGIDVGSGYFADRLLEPLVSIMLQSSDSVMKLLIILAIVFIILDIITSGLTAFITDKHTNTISVVISKIITYTMLLWLMNNWFSGRKIFSTYIFKPMFIYIPEHLVGSQINLDYVWDSLMSIVSRVFNSAVGGFGIWSILFGNIGVILILIFLSFVMWIQVALLYVKIVITMLQMYFIASFSFIAIIFNFNEFLAKRWGAVMIKTYLVLTVQYTMLFILIKVVNIGADAIAGNTVGSSGLLSHAFTSPINVFIMAAMLYMLVKLADKCVDLIVNVANRM